YARCSVWLFCERHDAGSLVMLAYVFAGLGRAPGSRVRTCSAWSSGKWMRAVVCGVLVWAFGCLAKP
ncbi:MAG TPA: hypothetical protein VIV12_22995, partial [Streptosporangiaceae bacterium]